jgi:hypothetical protein
MTGAVPPPGQAIPTDSVTGGARQRSMSSSVARTHRFTTPARSPTTRTMTCGRVEQPEPSVFGVGLRRLSPMHRY